MFGHISMSSVLLFVLDCSEQFIWKLPSMEIRISILLEFSGLYYCLFVKVLCCCRFDRNSDILSHLCVSVNNFLFLFLKLFSFIAAVFSAANIIITLLRYKVNSFFQISFTFFLATRYSYFSPFLHKLCDDICD